MKLDDSSFQNVFVKTNISGFPLSIFNLNQVLSIREFFFYIRNLIYIQSFEVKAFKSSSGAPKTTL